MVDFSNEILLHTRLEDVEYIQFRKLLEYQDVLMHAYTLKPNLDFKRERKEEMINSYQKLEKVLSFKIEDVVKPVQSHTDRVEIIKRDYLKREYISYEEQLNNVDGVITNNKNIVLSTTSADCISILFFDPVKKVIANTHSGWKGTLKQIAKNTVQKMIDEEKCNPKDIFCFICPSIRKCHFEVDKDVKDLFEQEFSYLDNIDEIIIPKGFVQNREKWNIDTVAINREILKKIGIQKENIIDSNLCTVCEKEHFHSYRIEGKDYGLNTAIITLK